MKQFTEFLHSSHNRRDFNCGKTSLDHYLQYQANQDIKRKLSACFVLIEMETKMIKGYYTLSNNSIPLDIVPERIKKKLPKSYLSIPTTLLGRLAVDKRFQGKGTGKLLLFDALRRSYEIADFIGSFAVIVDPMDKEAEDFYTRYGFIKLPESGKMFLPMNTIKQLFEE